MKWDVCLLVTGTGFTSVTHSVALILAFNVPALKAVVEKLFQMLPWNDVTSVTYSQ